MTGGYKIIDCKDVNIVTADGATIHGIYNEMENTRKVILLTNVTLDGVKQKDAFVGVYVTDSNFTFTAYGKTFTVTNADKVTFA